MCTYLAGTATGLKLTYYPTGTPLSVLTARVSGPLSPISSDGKEESPSVRTRYDASGAPGGRSRTSTRAASGPSSSRARSTVPSAPGEHR